MVLSGNRAKSILVTYPLNWLKKGVEEDVHLHHRNMKDCSQSEKVKENFTDGRLLQQGKADKSRNYINLSKPSFEPTQHVPHLPDNNLYKTSLTGKILPVKPQTQKSPKQRWHDSYNKI